MSNIADSQKALAGTLLNDRGGEATLNALFDVYVKYQHAAPDAAAGDTFNKNIFQNTLGVSLRLEEATYIPDAALTSSDTVYLTLTVLKGVAGTVTTAQAALDTRVTAGTGNWVADTPEALTLNATAANRVVADQEIVCVAKTIASTGTILPAGVLQLKFRRV